MTNLPFRFLHAADLHLELPVAGLSNCPEHLMDQVLDAPRRAAERLFQAAISEKVDFILLCGDLLSLQETGPWGAVFYLEQFERLRREGIEIYWIGGKSDEPSLWPEVLPLPENVHLFPSDQVSDFIFSREGSPLVRIFGMSRGKGSAAFHAGDFPIDPDGLYTIGMLSSPISYDLLRGSALNYWALGGTHKRDTSIQGSNIIHNPGVTLARSPADGDIAGASLVTVDDTGKTEIQPVKISPIRWSTERLVFQEENPEEETILAAMRERLINLRKTQGDELLFVSWLFSVPTPLATELRYGNLTLSLLRAVRSEFGRERPLIWTLSIEPMVAIEEDDDNERQTILGDYLRMIRFYKENSSDPVHLSDYFPDELKEYLAMKLAAARHRLAVDTPASEEEKLPEGEIDPIRSFRPEATELVRLLSVDMEEIRDFRPLKEHEKNDPRFLRLRSFLNAERENALSEAAMLGRELLVEEPSESPSTVRTIRKRSSLLNEEHKVIDHCPGGKEPRR